MCFFKIQILIILLICSFIVKAQRDFVFIPNAGQWDERVQLKADVKGGALFLEKNGLTFSFYDEAFFHNLHEGKADSVLKFHAYKVEFLNSNSNVNLEIKKFKPTLYNYYLGNDKSKWASGLKGGTKVSYTNLYPNINLDIYSHKGSLKYEFIVLPGGNPKDIQLKIVGASALELMRGDLKISTTLNEVIDKAPFVYQGDSTKEIKSAYQLIGNVLTFELFSDFNRNQNLIIDPELIFSTYSGSTADNFGFSATFDNDGFLYAGGSVFSQGYPTTLGAYDITFNSNPPTGNWGVSDIGISKYDTTGTKHIYSTYIGGSNCELPHSLIVNSKNELFIFGTTGSNNYPTTLGAYDATFNGGTGANFANGIFVNYTAGSDIIVTSLNANGTALLASTYFGGTLNDGLNQNLSNNYADQIRGEIILDENENVVIATSTFSNNIPITSGAFQTTIGGFQDGIVFKMSPNLNSLLWSSYFGGAGSDGIYSLIKSIDNNLFIAGGTRSVNLPINSASAYQSTFGGGTADGFFAKIVNNGTSVMGGSYYGSNTYDQIYFVREDRQQNVYVFGQSDKYGVHYISNAAYSVANSGQFISKFSPALNSRIWSTTFGSGNSQINISPTAFMVDLCDNIYLSGWGSPSGGFDGVGLNRAKGTAGLAVTPDAFQGATDGSDFYLMVLKDDASALVYGSFFGGNLSQEHVDGGTSRFDNKGVMYQSVCAGCGGNDDFPIQPIDAVSPTNNASCNNGVFKFDFNIPTIVADFNAPTPGCSDFSYDFKNTSKTLGATTYLWDFGDNSTSTLKNPSHQYATHGTYQVKLIISDLTSCNLIDSISKTFVLKTNDFQIAGTDTVCKGDSLQVAFSQTYIDTSSYAWSPGHLFSNSTLFKPKAYIDSSITLTLLIRNLPGCVDTLLYPVFVPEFVLQTTDIVACKGDSVKISIPLNVNFETYQWSSDFSFTDNLNSPSDSSFFNLKANATKKYYVKTTDISSCVYTDSLELKVIDFNLQISSDSIVCSLNPVIGKILSPSGLDSISWSPLNFVLSGANTTQASLSVHDYLNDYFVFASDTNGCEDRDSLRIVNNTIDYKLNDTTICFGETLQLGYKLDYNPLFTYLWIPDVVFDKDSLYTQITPNDTISLKLIVNNSFCIDTVPQTVNVNRVQIGVSADTVLCNHNGVYTLFASGSDALNYTWFYPQVFTDTLSKNVKNISVNPNFGAATYYVQGIDNWGCKDTAQSSITKVLYGLNYPSDTTLCLNDTVSLSPKENIAGMGNLQFWWSPSSIITTDTSLSSVKAYTSPGEWKVVVKSKNELGCLDVDTIKVKFASLDTSIIKLSISDSIITRGDKVIITGFPANATYSFVEETPTEINGNQYTFKPQSSTTYSVLVQDQQFNNCQKMATVEVDVLNFLCIDPYIFVPNAFTPNGDGDNDILYVRGKHIGKLYFAIFNRWGQKVFETTNQHIGWDGIFNGMKIDPAVYDYYLQYECEGEEQEYFKKGNITLIR